MGSPDPRQIGEKTVEGRIEGGAVTRTDVLHAARKPMEGAMFAAPAAIAFDAALSSAISKHLLALPSVPGTHVRRRPNADCDHWLW
ncbi:MAG: hypothetical protein HKN63_00625 [Rhodobacteraceae bacterium]|nr:hypothetical protein [Paracoccaceae bacterium]